jgi:hypothetical protein
MPRVAEQLSAGALEACWEVPVDDHVIRLEWSKAGVIAAACIGGPIHLLVSELHCSEPGCPPLETMVAVLEGPGKRRQFKFHKPIAEITSDDIHSAIRSA